MGLKQNYIRMGAVPLASYNYTEIASGLGYVKFTCFSSRPAGTLTYWMSDAAMETGYFYVNPIANAISTERACMILNNAAAGDVTFITSPFQTPRTLGGTIFVNFTIVLQTTNAEVITPTVTLYKNAVSLGSSVCATVSGGAVPYCKTYNISFTVADTVIARGDVLKLKISATAPNVAANKVYIAHDPLNRDFTSYTITGDGVFPSITATSNPTQCLAYIPFKIK